MMKEFKIAWPMIKKDGFLLSDDVAMHDAFLEFADQIKTIPIVVEEENGNYFGIIQK